jgi:hypothetical protein
MKNCARAPSTPQALLPTLMDLETAPGTPAMDTKSEKDLDLLSALPTLTRRLEGETDACSDVSLKPVDVGFGAWSFVSVLTHAWTTMI